jgi:hypothetical protein
MRLPIHHPFRTLALLSALAMAPFHGYAAGPDAAAPTVPKDWCRLDAPGLYGDLRSKAAASGAKQVPDCPAPDSPRTLPESLLVPLPCGRTLALRRVDVTVADILDQTDILIGGTTEDTEMRLRYTQGLHAAPLAGTFSLGKDGKPAATLSKGLAQRSYYIAAYEWTALQHAVFTSGALALWSQDVRPSEAEAAEICAKTEAQASEMRFGSVLPQEGLGWFDVQDLIGQLNDYVMAESRRRVAAGDSPLVPWEQGSSGFFRLPSEAEWEYAAQGGISGDLANRNPSVYSVADDQTSEVRLARLDEITTLPADGARDILFGVGRKLPNRLGLYDMVGNVSEMVHDLFQMVRADQLQGSRGGFVLRGGNSLTPAKIMGISHRQEMPLYTIEGQVRSPVAGVRLALVAPVLTFGAGGEGKEAYRTDLANPDFLEALRAADSSLVQRRVTPGAEFREQARSLIRAIRTGADTEQLDARLFDVEQALQQSEVAINDAQSAELRATTHAAATALLNVRANSLLCVSILQARHRVVEGMPQLPKDSKERQELEAAVVDLDKRLAQQITMIEYQTRAVLALIQKLAVSDPDQTEAAIETVTKAVRDQGLTMYDASVWPLFQQAYMELREDPSRDLFAKYLLLFDVQRDRRDRLLADQSRKASND